jgi:hypothetical protein
MPQYFFHVRDDMDVPDEEGAEFGDIEVARRFAAQSARVLMCETLREDGRITLSHRIDIEDGDGGVLASVRFRDAIRIEC